MLFNFYTILLYLYFYTVLSCSFLFLIIDLYFLIPEAITQTFNFIVKLVIHITIPNKETKVEIEIHLVIAEAKTRNYSI